MTKNLKTIFIDSFKKMFDFKTRASKYDYWGFMLANSLVGILFAFFAFVSPALGVAGIYAYFGIYIIYVILQTIVVLSLSVRRLHDTNHSGKWLLVIFVPFLLAIAVSALKSISSYQSGGVSTPSSGLMIFIGVVLIVVSIAFLVMMCKKGSAEENRFGKAVEENPNSNKLANICCLLYFVITIVSGVISAVLDKNSADENVSANGVASGTAVVDAQNSEAEEETTEPATNETEPAVNETESATAEDVDVEAPSVPLHENAE